ncbi:glycosyltransferase family 9 protein [Marinobacter pelagius]|uniref:glycosyltransferase family 9 protein n=1 Tax=Marinobacter sp. C7 TaxID=2951363 RepID=UPI001EEF85A4|nr:glycosyltransferase family 9 protein [Marinobacter sp. C7]MCG7201372.1 glycosyltransferase family 9 protein [Marinobacter sp. C7]
MKSICILRLSAIGDVTHVIPVVLSLQEQLPDVKITWVIGKIEAKLIGDLPGVEFIIFDKKAGRAGYADLRRQMKGRRFDALLHMQVAFRANLASACIPAKIRVGYDRARSKDLHSLFINRRIAPAAQQHVRDCLASFLEPLGLQAAPPRWTIPRSESDREFARTHLAGDRRNLVISPCASHRLRNWPTERYAQIADYAIRQHGMKVILVGSPAPFELEYCAAIESAMQETAHNICGKDTLKQLTALMAEADLVIAPDTGPAHIASAVGTDVIGLFAASNPNRSGPYNSLQWCVNRYPEALEKFTGKTVEEARWGTKAEFEGAMELVTVEDVVEMLDRWVRENSGLNRGSDESVQLTPSS